MLVALDKPKRFHPIRSTSLLTHPLALPRHSLPLTWNRQALGWHNWRARASRAVAATPTTTSPAPTPTPLAEAHALLDAVDPNTSNGSGGRAVGASSQTSTAKPITGRIQLQRAELAQALVSPELAALRAAVEAKDSATALAWGARRRPPTEGVSGDGGGGVGRRGWGDAFAAPPSGVGGGGRQVEWNSWRGSVKGLVDGMEGVLMGLVQVMPALCSALERHLEMR